MGGSSENSGADPGSVGVASSDFHPAVCAQRMGGCLENSGASLDSVWVERSYFHAVMCAQRMASVPEWGRVGSAVGRCR